MKILAINSSFRGNKGYTKYLIDKLFDGAKEAGADCELINLSELNIKQCIDCQVCQTETHFLQCIHKDDAAMVYDKMRAADLIVFATPVYVFSMSSLLRILMERYYFTCKMSVFSFTKSGLFFHNVDKRICSKPFAVLITCDNTMDETPQSIIDYFKIYSKFMDAKLAGILVRKSGSLVGHGKEPEKEAKYPAILDIYDAYRQAGSELAARGQIERKTLKRANKPLVQIPPLAKLMMRFPFVQKEVEKRFALSMETAIKR
ncbi:MAG: flavodoxin family protein [Clostridia bacterium]|nr:flavodoxin family protein [Clostridia bacterium]